MSELNIVVFDVETTGTDKQKDQIIELCVQFGLGSDAPSRTWRIRPEVAMNPGAQKVHGISMADLAQSPLFSEVADELRSLFLDAEMLVGYNLRFDIDMLQAEYRRLQQPPLDFTEKLIVDPYRLWQNSEPRSLMDAHRRFVGSEFESAHSAAADVAATGRVLTSMVSAFGYSQTGPQDWDRIADVCEPDRASWIGGSKHLRWSDDGRLAFGFGKHMGIVLSDMAAGADAGYMRWLVNKDFPPHVVLACQQALSLSPDEFASWAETEFPKPKSADAGDAQAVVSKEPAQKPPKKRKPEPTTSSSQLAFDLG